jgi:DNA polymerase-3 subunit delta'
MFANLIGNQPAKLFVAKLLKQRRFPNAILFAGPDGVGKKAFALETARAFVCTKDGVEPCTECAACDRAQRLNIPKPDKRDEFKEVIFTDHPDVGMVVPYNRNILVDAIRDLEKEARYRPFEAAARVFIIDEADKMNDAASNALLKTLEEPAASSHIILISSRPDSLLPTIRSRCQMLRFAPVAAAEIEEHLVRNDVCSAEDAAFAARVAGGSVAKAKEADVGKIRDARSAMLGLVGDALRHNIAPVLQTAERMNDAKNKDDLEANLSILEGLIRDVWLLTNGGDASGLINADIAGELASFATRAEAKVLALWMEEIERLREQFIVNINRKVATDALVVKMARA